MPRTLKRIRLVKTVNLNAFTTITQLNNALSGPHVNERWEITSIAFALKNIVGGVTTLSNGSIVRGPETVATWTDPSPGTSTDRLVVIQFTDPLLLYPGESIGTNYLSSGPGIINFGSFTVRGASAIEA